MTKDKLLRHLFDLKELACKSCSGEEEKCFSCGIKLGTIFRILDYHFSITEQERKEAAEWARKELDMAIRQEIEERQKRYQTILKALGE